MMKDGKSDGFFGLVKKNPTQGMVSYYAREMAFSKIP